MKALNFFKSIALGTALISGISLSAQCPAGQVEVYLDVTTDTYGYETYWEIVPTGNPCGVGTIASGGSTVVGCNGGGVKAQNQSSGYQNNNSLYAEGPWCLTDGACYDLIFVDDWGDGGGTFDIKVSGFNIANFTGVGSNATWTFCASAPLTYDAGVKSLTSPYLLDDTGMKSIKGLVFNYGQTTITSVDVSYQIDNDPIQTNSFTGLNVANFQGYNFTHPTQWNASIGTYTLKVWSSNINGNSDMDASNDTITKTIEIGPGIPNIIDSYVGITPTITQIGNSGDLIATPSDLDFHPALSNKQLWVVNKGHSNNTASGGSSMVIFTNAGEPSQTDVYKKDGNAKHFMNSTTGIAFSKNGNWANSPGVYDANFNGSVFTGPSLWSGDPAIFAVTPPGGNGSHLDMLHESPYSQGIASESGNAFWLFDGNYNDIVRYDFVNDHGPGNSYHDDGIVHRYRTQIVAKDPNNKVGSHVVVSDGWVYVVDYGNQRIFRIQMGTGNFAAGAPVPTQKETLAEYKDVINYTTEMVVTTGLVEPCGIDIVEDRMIVSDYSTGEVIIYDITTMPAVELDRLSTGAMGIMGIKIGPLGKIWYVDYDANTVNRIDGLTTDLDDNTVDNSLSIYPNPTKNNFSINLKGVFTKNLDVRVFDLTGKLIYTTVMKNNTVFVNTENWVNGIYQVHLSNNNYFSVEKIVVQH